MCLHRREGLEDHHLVETGVIDKAQLGQTEIDLRPGGDHNLPAQIIPGHFILDALTDFRDLRQQETGPGWKPAPAQVAEQQPRVGADHHIELAFLEGRGAESLPERMLVAKLVEG